MLQPQVVNDIRKSEPPDAGETVFDMTTSSLRAKSEDKPKRQRSKIFAQNVNLNESPKKLDKDN